MDLVLASGSVWRKALLVGAGIPCRSVASDVDEEAIVGDSPSSIARARALAKARRVAAGSRPGEVVLGADQVVHLGGSILGKPRDREAHLAMLASLRGCTHELVTSVALIPHGTEPGWERCFEVATTLTMRPELSDAELAAYVDCGEAAGCGGGYMIEAMGAQLFTSVQGDWYNVVGLPLFRLITELRDLGWTPSFTLAADSGAVRVSS